MGQLSFSFVGQKLDLNVSARKINVGTLFFLFSINNQSPSSSVQQVKTSKNDENDIQKETGKKVTSPIIGTAYHAPEPGAKKFVEIGKKIKKGDTVMIVEAMKTMNHIPSPADGIVKEISVQDGQPVEYGQTIIILE